MSNLKAINPYWVEKERQKQIEALKEETKASENKKKSSRRK